MHYETLTQLSYMINLIHFHRDKLPAILSNYFTKNYMFHSYSTRIKDSLHVDLFASSLGNDQ